MTARNKAKKAEDTSDLNSDCKLSQKRKKIKRKISYTESSESECETSTVLLPTPPKIRLNMQKNKLMPNNGLRGNENSIALASLEKKNMPTSTGG